MGKDINQETEVDLVLKNVCIIATLGCIAWFKINIHAFCLQCNWKLFVVMILLYDLLPAHVDLKLGGHWK